MNEEKIREKTMELVSNWSKKEMPVYKTTADEKTVKDSSNEEE